MSINSRPVPAHRHDAALIHGRYRARSISRRGISTMMVVGTLGATVMLTYAFLQSQAVTGAVAQNVNRRKLAEQAAHAGAVAALQAIHSATWPGVGTPLTAVVTSDNTSTTSYIVQYQPWNGTTGQTLAADNALYMRIYSTGRWQATPPTGSSSTTLQGVNTAATVDRHLEVIVRLQPRPPGRTLSLVDTSAAQDLVPNPAGFDAAQVHAVFAGSNSTSLSLDPGNRIEGNAYVQQTLSLFSTPGWDNTTRNRVLGDLATKYVTTSGGQPVFAWGHPFAGTLIIPRNPGSIKNDLSTAGIPYSQVANALSLPAFNFSGWQSYKVLSGGFSYNAVPVSGTLQSVTLRPSPQNPLGIFYATGSLTVLDNVNVQGTLVSNGTISVYGDNVQFTSFNWKGTTGTDLISQASLWPRLPALVANSVSIDAGATVAIEGATLAQTSFTGGGGRFEYASVPDLSVSGTAVSAPAQQPWSTVTLTTGLAPANLLSDGSYSIWLQRGTSGDSLPIVGIDSTRQKLTVVGEVSNPSPVAYVIRRSRQQSLSIRGPVCCGGTVNLRCPSEWNLWSWTWSVLYSAWQTAVSNTPHALTPPLFLDWLATAGNLSSWPYPFSTYGLTLEPTATIQNAVSRHVLWSPPLFAPYQSTDASAGYRWTTVAWNRLD